LKPQIVLGFLAAIIVNAFSRWREFHADDGGSKLAGNQNMIDALKALQRNSRTEKLKGEFAAFGEPLGEVGDLGPCGGHVALGLLEPAVLKHIALVSRTGGVSGINESHFIGAAYGMERMMGKADTPLRRILNKAEELFCGHLPVIYVQTVVGPRPDGSLATRGLYIGTGTEPFEAAAELAVEVNFTQLEEEPERIVCYLDPTEFHSTWLGNKAIYRTRMAIATGGELTVLAPAVKEFGEDSEIDRLIRKYGYRTSPEVMDFVEKNDDLANNLSAAAHLIHGSSEGRFTVTYCPGELTREEVEGVGYQYRDLTEALNYYQPGELKEGWNTDRDGKRFYYIPNPALGLWAAKSRL
jgi:hypothetical protein